jgi:hypothetical protein
MSDHEMADQAIDDTTDDHDISWATVNKPQVRIPIKNRFDPLQQNDQPSDKNTNTNTNQDVTITEPEPIPPAFYLEGISDVNGMIKKFTSLTGENKFTYKCQRSGDIKVNCVNINSYKILTKFLKDKKLPFHTYQIKSERTFNIIISGLHKSYKIDDLCYYLKLKGHNVRSATIMQKKVYDRDSETYEKVLLDKFIVNLEPAPNNKDVYNIKDIDHCIVHVEAPHKQTNDGVPPQCSNCLRRGHTKNYCYRPPRCVKCGENHHFSKCTLQPHEKAKCAHCGMQHTASYKGCIDYQSRIKKAPLRENRTQPEFIFNPNDFKPLNPNTQTPQNERPNVSYSEITNQEKFFKRIEEMFTKQIDIMNNLMNMMNTLITKFICPK